MSTDAQQPGQTVQPIVTTCRDCIFAEYQDNRQVGCQFDRLHAFDENGAVVAEAEAPDGKKHFLIMGRFCNACRNHEWGKKHPPHKWQQIVEEEFAVRVAMVIYVDDSTSLVELERTLQSVFEQTKKAHGLFVVLNHATLQTRTYVNLIRSMNPPMKWEIRDIVPAEDGTYPDMGRAVDIAVQYCKTTYYSLCKAGYVYPSYYIATIENAINVDMQRFVALLPDADGNGLLVQTTLHNYIKGNAGLSIVEKLLDISAEEKTEYMIKAFEELPLWHG